MISNPSILLGLLQNRLLADSLFSSFRVSATDLMCKRELTASDKKKLQQKGIRIQSLPSEILQAAIPYGQKYPCLCRDEVQAFVWALNTNTGLLGSSLILKDMARAERIPFFELAMLLSKI